VALLALATGCADKVLDASSPASGVPAGEACDPAEEEGCAAGLRCEPLVEPEQHACAWPFLVRGRVIDAVSLSPLVAARVSAADEQGAPVTAVAETDDEGRYALPVTVRRDAAGEPAEAPRWRLLASARDYLEFPGALRPALPLDAAQATVGEPPDASWVLESTATEIALVPLPAALAGGVTVTGRVEGEHASGTLVVAEGPAVEGALRAPFAVADVDGGFALFNVQAGTTTVRGYRQGVELEPVEVAVGTADIEGVALRVLTEQASAMATVEGSVVIVDAAGGLTTSVVLVPSSAYDAALEHGPVPPGLRAPAPPEAPSVSGAFSIAGVPAGRYRVLAAFENDQLVRDPDASIGGTQVPEVEVPRGQVVALDASFKVTRALEVVGPGADGLEEVDGAPVLSWIDDASEDRYALVVYDARGMEVWRVDELPRVNGGGVVEVPYGGPALVPGMLHQFRATSWSDGPQGSTALTRTEELRGVFVVR
jgi:hypothetical protein